MPASRMPTPRTVTLPAAEWAAEAMAASGHKGGQKVSEKYPHEHFEEIGHKGGQKVRDLIDKGKEAEKK